MATKKACDKFRDVPTSVINFVEGTRFTKEKQSVSASPYSSLLKPRAGGIALAIDAMGDMFDKILDVTIVYPQGVISFWDLFAYSYSTSSRSQRGRILFLSWRMIWGMEISRHLVKRSQRCPPLILINCAGME